ncbi:phBC6A51 family helix-turn-helix protein [Clostridium beijerinckii]|uniref:IS30 family transposase n=1 Tax=Clostridium beijerinckii TaxID=1520 RepID=A0AAE5LN59_CLOBE|nr:phBC6A51 family helix-turn-helix protein [Clostridium beijerinckii]NSB12113.1 IS30 family transposase [Clostridium beijerinckii]OOM27447.1 hypothetical protein CLOBE_30050 [Clostridium beijerinckii]
MAKKILTEQQKECINLLVLGTMSKLQIANSIGCAEKTIYNWVNHNPEFRDSLQKCSDLFAETKILDAKNKLSTHLDMAIANLVEIANDKSNSKQYEANKYIIDRNLGNTTTKVENSLVDNNSNNSNSDTDKSYLEEIEQELEEAN